jgi:hypothetical protein
MGSVPSARAAVENPTMEKLLTVEFSGKTPVDCQHQFLEWYKQNAGKVRNVNAHPVERMTYNARTNAPQYSPLRFQDQYRMVVEYEEWPKP